MPLYTVVLEFDGGTYIQQFRAASAFSAAAKHAVRLVKNNDIGTVATRKRLAHKLATDKPTAIQGMRNVWCCFASVGRKSALVNIIATAN